MELEEIEQGKVVCVYLVDVIGITQQKRKRKIWHFFEICAGVCEIEQVKVIRVYLVDFISITQLKNKKKIWQSFETCGGVGRN